MRQAPNRPSIAPNQITNKKGCCCSNTGRPGTVVVETPRFVQIISTPSPVPFPPSPVPSPRSAAEAFHDGTVRLICGIVTSHFWHTGRKKKKKSRQKKRKRKGHQDQKKHPIGTPSLYRSSQAPTDEDPDVLLVSKLWQPRSWRFMLLRTLKALPQPGWGHLKGFSPVCEWPWIRSELGREKALPHVWQMYLSCDCW